MNVYFWGTRGSLPTPLTAEDVRAKVRAGIKEAQSHDLPDDESIDRFIDRELPFSVAGCFGGNTSCVELQGALDSDDHYLLFDGGSGLRDFGNAYMAAGKGGNQSVFHVFLSHLHWDHLQGMPFFVPAYIPGNKVIFHSHHDQVKEAVTRQMDPPTFPVPFEYLGAEIEFDYRPPGEKFELEGFDITTIEQNHPGTSYGYRFEKGGKTFVYSNDSEHKEDCHNPGYPFIEFFRGADVVIFDAQYTFADAVRLKSDWGHSSNIIGVELASQAGVKNLCLCHNEPTASDEELLQIQEDTRRYYEIMQMDSEDGGGMNIHVAYDSLSIEL